MSELTTIHYSNRDSVSSLRERFALFVRSATSVSYSVSTSQYSVKSQLVHFVNASLRSAGLSNYSTVSFHSITTVLL